MADLLRLAGVVKESIVDGPGMRFVLFTQGCPHRCPACHNPATHSRVGGQDHPVEELIMQYRENPLLAGITLSGGEPFLQAEACADFASRIHALGGTVVTYTGYVYEQLLKQVREGVPFIADFLAETDLLIDGPFVIKQKDLTLRYRGSRNQRLLSLSAMGEQMRRQALSAERIYDRI